MHSCTETLTHAFFPSNDDAWELEIILHGGEKLYSFDYADKIFQALPVPGVQECAVCLCIVILVRLLHSFVEKQGLRSWTKYEE